MELACQAGYRNNSLGFARIMPEKDTVNVESWMKHLKEYRHVVTFFILIDCWNLLRYDVIELNFDVMLVMSH